jgi:hypothetical protein
MFQEIFRVIKKISQSIKRLIFSLEKNLNRSLEYFQGIGQLTGTEVGSSPEDGTHFNRVVTRGQFGNGKNQLGRRVGNQTRDPEFIPVL